MLQTVRRKPIGRKFETPEAHADWVKHDRLGERLGALARKAEVIAFALEGLSAVEGSETATSIQIIAYELKDALEGIADEVREVSGAGVRYDRREPK